MKSVPSVAALSYFLFGKSLEGIITYSILPADQVSALVPFSPEAHQEQDGCTYAARRIALCTALKTQLSSSSRSRGTGAPAGHLGNGLPEISAERKPQEHLALSTPQLSACNQGSLEDLLPVGATQAFYHIHGKATFSVSHRCTFTSCASTRILTEMICPIFSPAAPPGHPFCILTRLLRLPQEHRDISQECVSIPPQSYPRGQVP